jgi:hypothetical protein
MVKREGGRQGNSVSKAFVAQSEQLSSGLVAANNRLMVVDRKEQG